MDNVRRGDSTSSFNADRDSKDSSVQRWRRRRRQREGEWSEVAFEWTFGLVALRGGSV
ncbi:hypothetical protein [Haloarcula sp. K1]|uniref:hypothetical protein n=1 Tax=Haloarcula sp. K1 TaxID=1622207 RepID=UPI0012BA8550|nr:hypothetical protein [Haloarcula sp. K1]